jgi:hypothetical protein
LLQVLYGSLPWWSFAITSLIVAVAIHQRPGRAFLSGFLGVFLLWGVLAFMKDAANEHLYYPPKWPNCF